MLELCGNIPYVVINMFPSFVAADAIGRGRGGGQSIAQRVMLSGVKGWSPSWTQVWP